MDEHEKNIIDKGIFVAWGRLLYTLGSTIYVPWINSVVCVVASSPLWWGVGGSGGF